MSGLFGGGSGGGKLNVQDVNIPAFTSSGGITPQQQELGQYSYGQDLLAQGNLFAGDKGMGTGMSTMATQGAEGAKNTEAQQLAGYSDTDQGAMYQLYQNQVGGFEQSLQNDLTLQNANQAVAGQDLSSLVKAAGFSAGSGTGTPTA